MLKKFLFLLFFILFFIILFNTDAFATDITFVDKNENIIVTTLPNGVDNKNFCIFDSVLNKIILLSTSSNSLYIRFSASTNYVYSSLNSDSITVGIYEYSYDTNSFNWINNTNSYINDSFFTSRNFISYYCSENLKLYCHSDFYNIFDAGELIATYDTYYTFFLSMSTTEQTTSVDIYTNYFYLTDIYKFDAYISKGNLDDFEKMDIATLDEGNVTYFKFVAYDITENDTYYIRIVNNTSGKEDYLSLTVTNIISGTELLNFHLSTTEQTTEPIYILSNQYFYDGDYNTEDDFLQDYEVTVAYGYDSPYQYSPSAFKGYDETSQKYYTQYQYKIVINGVYKLKIVNKDTKQTTYQTFVINNIGIANQWGEDVYYNNYNENGEFDPTPVLFLEYVDTTTVRIRTQPFIFNELILLQCYFSSDGEEYKEITNIYTSYLDTNMDGRNSGGFGDAHSTGGWSGGGRTDGTGGEIIPSNEQTEGIIETYYFYQDVNIDGTYYFKFYNIELDKYTVASIDVNIREFIADNIDNIDSSTDKMVAWSKLHFGFLTCPFELIINIFNRVTNINYSEPILYIPELKDPATGITFLSETSYNLNDAVNINDTTRNIYNIYLVIVDVIIIFLFVMLCKKIFNEVFK